MHVPQSSPRSVEDSHHKWPVFDGAGRFGKIGRRERRNLCIFFDVCRTAQWIEQYCIQGSSSRSWNQPTKSLPARTGGKWSKRTCTTTTACYIPNTNRLDLKLDPYTYTHARAPIVVSRVINLLSHPLNQKNQQRKLANAKANASVPQKKSSLHQNSLTHSFLALLNHHESGFLQIQIHIP